MVAEGHLEKQLLDEDDQPLNPVLWVAVEGERVVGEVALGSAVQTFKDAFAEMQKAAYVAYMYVCPTKSAPYLPVNMSTLSQSSI